MAGDYVLPQALVYQEFTRVPDTLAQPQNVCIIGPQYALIRYTDADEKADGKLTDSYESDADTAYSWPNRPAGGVVDTDYTRVFIDDALLLYYEDVGGDASTIEAVADYRNRIRFDSLVLKTANGYTRSVVFRDRDVAVGDVLDISATACGEAVSLRTQILSLIADIVDPVIDAPTADADNAPTQLESSDDEQTAGDVNNVCISAVGTAGYDGRYDGQVSETYRIEVVVGSTGGNAETATLRITALSGTENPVEITPEAFGAPTDIGDRGLTVTFNNDGCGSSSSGAVDMDDFLVGQTWLVTVNQAFTEPTTSSGGTYLGADDMTYIVEVVSGGDAATAEYHVSSNIGTDASGPAIITATGVALPVGTHGVTLTFDAAATGFCKGDRFYIEVTAQAEGAVKTVAVSTPLPDSLRGECDGSSSSSESPADLAVKFYIKSDIEVPANRVGYAPLTNWEQSATQITINSGIISYDSTWTYEGVLQPLEVKDGIVYAHYRALVNQWVEQVGSVSDVSEISDTFSAAPEIDSDNPLVFGVYKALLNANGEDVLFTGVGASSPIELSDWTDALEVLTGRSDTFSLVPLTQDKDVLDAVVAHCASMSSAENGRWRIAWLNMAAETEEGVYTTSLKTGNVGGVILATVVDDPDATGTQYTLLQAEGEKFITGARDVDAGDIVRIQYTDDGFGNETYSEFVIDAVLNDEEIRLYTGPDAAINVPSKMEIWHNFTKTEMATELSGNPGLFSTRRAYLVWPDTVGNAGESYPGYYMCAALAGLRSSSLPHRPLTNVEILGFDDVGLGYFTEAQLNTMAEAGYWIVTQDPDSGAIYTRHQLSTDNTDLNTKEQSVTTNIDSISYAVRNRVAPYIGRGNVTPIMLGIIEGELLAILDYYVNFVVVDSLGAQITSYSIVRLAQHALLKDRIQAIINVVLPYPFNNAEIHLVV